MTTGHDPHCTCIGVWLCTTCHTWVHAHHGQARTEGFVLASAVTDPYNHPVQSWRGAIYLDCEGSYEAAEGTHRP